MAKISTYPNVGTPVLSDMLIGTDVTDSNATKNFMISDILGLIGSLGLYVPYTGATANVNLGSFNLSAQDLTLSGDANFNGAVYVNDLLFDVTSSSGLVGQILSSTGTGVQWINLSSLTLNLQQVLDDGNTATQNINLTGTINTSSINYTTALYAFPGSTTFFGGDVTLEKKLLDGASFSPGLPGQLLSSTGLYTQWINPSSLSIGLQQVLNTSGVANGDIALTGATNGITLQGAGSYLVFQGLSSYISQIGASAYIEQTGANAQITQAGVNAFIEQTGATSKIQQAGINAEIKQTAGVGSAARIIQSGENSYFSQTGANAYIEQTGISALIKQTGSNPGISQTGTNAFIEQTGINAYIEQTGANTGFSQTGTNSYIEQTGASAYIEQTGGTSFIKQNGAGAYIEQVGTTGYIKPAQIRDSANLVGGADDVLVSLGPNNGVEWQDRFAVGSFYDTTNQTTTVGVAVPMKFGSNDIIGYGVSITTDGSSNRTQIQVAKKGVYNVQFSAQLRNGAGAATVDIWFRLNGTNIANSNTSVTLQANTNDIAAWNYFVTLNPGDIFQIMWTQDSNNAFLSAAAAAAPHPATPSTILTVNRVR